MGVIDNLRTRLTVGGETLSRPSRGDESGRAATGSHERALGPLLTQHSSANNQSREQTVTVRILLGMVGLLGSISIIEGVALTELIPLKSVMPFFVHFSDKSDQMVTVVPPTGRIQSLAILLKFEIKQYMKARYTVTSVASETKDAWNTRVRLFSTARVFTDFEQENAEVSALMSQKRLTREVEIVNILNPEPGLFRVDFDTYDHVVGTGMSETQDKRNKFRAELKVAMNYRAIPRDQLEMNPFGFIVYAYTVSPRHADD